MLEFLSYYPISTFPLPLIEVSLYVTIPALASMIGLEKLSMQ
jgi:hypothetical protein